MRDLFPVFIVVAQASVMATAGWLVVTLATMPLMSLGLHRAFQIILTAIILSPTIPATWWLHRKLPLQASSERRAVSFAFAAFTPISIGVAVILALKSVALLESAGLRNRLIAMFSSYALILVFGTLSYICVCLFAVWITRRTEGTHQANGVNS